MPAAPVVMGITGVNGKSSTLKILENIFRGNHSTPGTSFKMFSSAQAEKPSIIEKIKDAGRQGVKYLFLEIPTRALSTPHIKSLNLHLLAVTNLTPEGLTGFPGKTAGLQSTFSKLMGENSTVLVNADDPLTLQMADITHSQVITYALDYANAMATAGEILLNPNQSQFKVFVESDITSLGGKIIDPFSQSFTLPLPGRHNIYNGLVAILMSLACDLKPEFITAGFSRLLPFKRCLETIYSNHFTIIDDGASNPGAIKSVLETIGSYPYRKLILVYALSGNQNTAINALNGKLISQWSKKINIKKVIVTKSIHQVNKKARASLQEEKAFLEECQNFAGQISVIPDLGGALQDSILSAQEGDIILLLGEKGMDPGASLSQKVLYSFSGSSG